MPSFREIVKSLADLMFDFQGKDVRVIAKDDSPWWFAKDVCNVLRLDNPTRALSSLDDDERNTLTVSKGRSKT